MESTQVMPCIVVLGRRLVDFEQDVGIEMAYHQDAREGSQTE